MLQYYFLTAAGGGDDHETRGSIASHAQEAKGGREGGGRECCGSIADAHKTAEVNGGTKGRMSCWCTAFEHRTGNEQVTQDKCTETRAKGFQATVMKGRRRQVMISHKGSGTRWNASAVCDAV